MWIFHNMTSCVFFVLLTLSKGKNMLNKEQLFVAVLYMITGRDYLGSVFNVVSFAYSSVLARFPVELL